VSAKRALRELQSTAMRTRVVAVLLALVVPAVGLAALTHVADAQTRKPGAAASKPAAARGGASGAAKGDGGIAAGTLAAPVPMSTSVSSPNGAQTDAGVVEAKTLDGGTHVFKFSELDIEGRLKSPQLVYFLRRVRAEFAAGELGHRSFMREMSETRKESTF
jgi:hypothetical protein